MMSNESLVNMVRALLDELEADSPTRVIEGRLFWEEEPEYIDGALQYLQASHVRIA